MNNYTDSCFYILNIFNKQTKFFSLLVLILLLMPAMASAEPSHYRITGNGGWGHFKLGHNTNTLWKPKVYPAVGQTHLELTLNGNGSTDWNLLAVRGKRDKVVLGDYISGNPQGFFTIAIPLSAFENGSFNGVANFSVPYAIGPEQIDVSVAKVAFTGGNEAYVWFDAEENKFDSKWSTQFVAAITDVTDNTPVEEADNTPVEETDETPAEETDNTPVEEVDNSPIDNQDNDNSQNANTAPSSYYEITGDGGWNHFKLGHNPDNLWSPKISPAEGMQFLRLTLNGFENTNWNKLAIKTGGDSARVTLGDYIEGEPQGWFTVDIPLSAFPSSAFNNISQMSIPFSRGTNSLHIGLARVEFIGTSDSFLWFGAPDKTDNAYSTPWSVNSKVAEIPGWNTDADTQIQDADNDAVADPNDNCPADANPNQSDADNDGIGDACDIVDADNDGVADSDDNCIQAANADQADSDNNGVGDVCDINDADNDGIADGDDNCPADANPAQTDSDNDGIGDACDVVEPDQPEEPAPEEHDTSDHNSESTGDTGDHYTGTPDIDDSFGAVVAPDRSGASWSAVASYYRDYPPLFGECSEEQHAKYWVKAVDGKVYPTWHPPVDASGCSFAHEHGDDPRDSDLYNLSGGIPFGFVHSRLMHGGGMGDRQEDHVGHKVVMRNDWTAVAGNPANTSDLMAELGDGFECDWLSKVHQGTHSSDALGNNMHEYFLNVSCKDGTHVSIKELAAWGQPSSFFTECSDLEEDDWIYGGFESTDTPIVYPQDPDPTNDDTSETGFSLNDGKRSVNCLADRINGRKDLMELWKPDGNIRSPQGGSVHFSPYYIIKNPNRYFDWQWVEHGLDNAMISSVDICVRGSEVWDKVVIPEHPEFQQAGYYPPLCHLNNLSPDLRSQWESEITQVKESNLEGDDLDEALALLAEKRRFHKDNPFDGSRRVTQPKRVQIYNNYSRQNTPEGHTKFCTNAFGKSPVWPDEDGVCPHGTLEQIMSSQSNNWDSISFTTEDDVTIRGISGSSINSTNAETGAIQNPNDNNEILISPGIGEEWIRDISDDAGVHAPN